ncbi:DEAD/DEAH box helicase [Corynebacterium urealyticum]|uniref:DEAD/DEAH box helicase n=1 Tax=Corynebacterium urealyticum TaxID=43771 RepID=UPI0011E71FE8|nr:DEAD/DEAH box helicase [Corynebacterium urealyticum]TYR17946.1 DEAD/DEAH box helicase [Corynebacterium urealyticum]
MQYKPHDYQHFATRFIETHPQAAIFLGMGMGKTVLTLTAIRNLILDHFTVHKALIIAPLRVARDTWPTEAAKWPHLNDLTTSTILGTPTQRTAGLNADADVYITNRENIPWLVEQTWPNWPFDMVVIDELSSFKNHKAQRFKALMKCRPKITRMVGLTGTPSPNGLLDLFGMFRLLDGGQRLGRFITHYRDRWFTPDKRNGAQVYSWKSKPGAEEEIYDAISDITVSMRTCDHLTLPEVTYQTMPVQLAAKEAKLYDTIKRDMVAELDGATVDAVNAAALSGKLQQLASGALYVDDDRTVVHVHDQKLKALDEIMDTAAGNTVLVAYWFKHERDRILQWRKDARELDTAEDFAAWNRGEVPLGLIHPASAGHGLNLQSGGHLMVWMTTPWSLELYEQANARLHRQGQTEPVSITHVVARGTIDERVLKALEGKAATQQALVQAVATELSAA